jgi:diaminopimelate decarboxylase
VDVTHVTHTEGAVQFGEMALCKLSGDSISKRTGCQALFCRNAEGGADVIKSSRMARGWEKDRFLEVRGGRLHVDGVDACELAREHGTPLFVFSGNRIRQNIARIMRAGELIDRPLKVCYAAKAMSTMGILKLVREIGIEIEVNSGGELWKALEAGFRGEQIIFNGTSKEVWELEMAITNEAYAIQVDSLYELSLINDVATRLGKSANVALRLVPEIETKTHSGLQTALLTSKFGMMPDEALQAFGEYKDSPHVDLCGIHLHIGSQNPDPTVYTEACEMLFDTLRNIDDTSGVRLKHINIGGGFPVDYLPNEKVGLPAEQAAMLAADFDPADALANAWQAVEDTAKAAGRSNLLDEMTILTEPGRSIIADAGICLTTVRNHKERPTSETTDHRPLTTDQWLLTDAGFNILLSMETYKWYYHLISADRAGEEHDFPYKLAGPLCDGGDVYFDIEGEGRLPEYRLLPRDVKPGEVLALLNCGAYSLAQASQYNGRFLPAVLLIRQNGNADVIRRRDSFKDLVNNDVY